MKALFWHMEEFRADDSGLEGIVVRYGDVAKVAGYNEQIVPGALRFDDVMLNIMHDRLRPVARTGGAGLVLEDGPEALRARVEWPETSIARDAREMVRAGILRGFSVEMRIREVQRRSAGYAVTRAEMGGIGLVDRPAYPESVVESLRAFAPEGPSPWLSLLA